MQGSEMKKYNEAPSGPAFNFNQMSASGIEDEYLEEKSELDEKLVVEEVVPDLPTSLEASIKMKAESAESFNSIASEYKKRSNLPRTQEKVRKYPKKREGIKIHPTLPSSTVTATNTLALLIQENRNSCTDPNFDRSSTSRCDVTGITNAFYDVCFHLLGKNFVQGLPKEIKTEIQLRDFLLRKAKEKYQN